MKPTTIISFGLNIIFVCAWFMTFYLEFFDFYETNMKKNPELWQCNNSCEISLNSSAISTYENFSMDSSSALFVHFSAYNLSLKPSNDILDPLNLVWVENIHAPFLSLDLDFHVYSFGMLSQKVHHMPFMLEKDAGTRCLWDMSYTCATKTLSTAFLRHVTRGRGVLCHAIKPLPVKYQCCSANDNSRQIECDISPLISSDMASIFITVTVVTTLTFFYFPVLLAVSFPDEDSSKTLSCNTQICINLVYQLERRFMKAVRRKWASYWADIVKTLIIGVLMPIFYYFYLILRWYIIKYEIPKMFNDDVKGAWGFREVPEWSFVVVYIIGIAFFALHHYPRDIGTGKLDEPSYSEYLSKLAKLKKAEKDFKINWMTPVNMTQDVVGIIWPFLSFLVLCGYAFSITATFQSIDFFVQRTAVYWHWCRANRKVRKSTTWYFLRVGFTIIIPYICAIYSIGIILNGSLHVIFKLIVYVYMGLVATKYNFLPKFTIIFVFGYYFWDCFNYESQKYQKLLEQTFEKCKQRQQGQAEPTISTLLQFDKKGAPIISTELFQKVIDEILPLSEVYTKLFLKITLITSFLSLTYFSILVNGESSVNDYTKALAIFLGAIIPKVVEIFRNNSSQLLDIENSYKIEKIVNDFINSNAIPRDYLPERSLIDDHAIEMTTLNSNETYESFVTAPSLPLHTRRRRPVFV